MRTNLLRSLFVVFICWYGAAVLLWAFADPPQNAAVQARAHAMLPWVVPAPPKEVGILNAWQVQLTVWKTWGVFTVLVAAASVGLGILLAYFKIDSRLAAIRGREKPRGGYRGMKTSLGELPPPDRGPTRDTLDVDSDDPLYQAAPPEHRALFAALAGYISANPQVPASANGTFLDECLERADLAMRVRQSFVAALVELAYATGRVGMHHRECNPYKPGEKIGFAKTQGYFAAKVLGAMPEWYALDEETRTEVLFGAKYYENPTARPYRKQPHVPPVPLPTPVPGSRNAPASDPVVSAQAQAPAVSATQVTPRPSVSHQSASVSPAANAPGRPSSPPRPQAPVPQAAAPTVLQAVPAPAAPAAVAPRPAAAPPTLPPPSAGAASKPGPAESADAQAEAAESGVLQASFFTTSPTPSFTIEDHLVRVAVPLLKGIEWGHAKVPRHEYQSATNPKGRPLPFGWRHGKYILLLSNRLEEYLRAKLPAPMVDEADSVQAPADLKRRGLTVSGLMAAFMRGLAKYEILHMELELDKPKGYMCRAAMPEVSLWTVKVGKARFKQVIVLRLRKSYVEYVTEEDGNFKDGMTVLDCYLPEKPIPAEPGVNVTPAVTDGVSLADAVGMGLFKVAAPAVSAPPVAATPEVARTAPSAPSPASPEQAEAAPDAPESLEELFEAAPDTPPTSPTREKSQGQRHEPRRQKPTSPRAKPVDSLAAAGLSSGAKRT